MDGIAGKRFLITGATSGIGRQMAIKLARLGANLFVTGRNQERLKDTLTLLEGSPGQHGSAPFDLSSSDGFVDFIKSNAQSFGCFDGFFHSAGIETIAPAGLMNEKRLHQLFAAGTFGLFSIARAVTKKGVSSEKCSIVAMSSVAAIRGQSGLSGYSASKGALDAAVRSLAVELSSRNVRVNSLTAGAIETEMHQRIIGSLDAVSIEQYRNKHLLGFGTADDVANAAVFLLSDSARWITGTNLVVDGGYSCK